MPPAHLRGLLSLKSSRRAFIFAQILSFLVVLAVALPVPASAQLSRNSGINAADTWVAVDLTVTTSGTITLPQAVNPATSTSSNVLNLAPPTLTFHVEAGYDSSGGLVMNVWPTGTPADPNASDTDAIGFIRFAGGQMTIFDQNGTPISPVFPRRSNLLAPELVWKQPRKISTSASCRSEYSNLFQRHPGAIRHVRFKSDLRLRHADDAVGE
jgi:hypothetical protein